MSSKNLGEGDLHVQLIAKDVRVTDSVAPVPNFVLSWLNRSKELVSMEIHLADFYNEGLFASIDANFVFKNMAEFLDWYSLEKTRDAIASLRELAKQRRVDFKVSTIRPEKGANRISENGNGSAMDRTQKDSGKSQRYS